jgi:uncharacterized membrane protein
VENPGRIASIDLLRGLIVAAMALDHTRDFFQPVGSGPEAFDTTSVAFFITRWVSHFCAPGFIFLAGVAVALYVQRRPDRPAMRFCLTRGLWLMLLEATWVSFSWYFHFEYTHLGVLWAIGGSMVLLAAVLWLPVRAVGVLGLTVTVLLAALPVPKDLPVLGVLCQPNTIELFGHKFFQSYAIVPWFGVMAAGYGFADLLVAERSRRWLPVVGGAMLLAFGGLRALNGFGDPAQWAVQERGDWATVAHFLNPSKYPPSLMFQLLFLGIAVAALPLLARLKGPIADVILAWGQVPMFFYLVHLPLIHVAGVIHAYLRYGDTHIPATVDLSLPLIYLAWMVLLAALWPACVAWRRFKRAKRQWWWLSYL